MGGFALQMQRRITEGSNDGSKCSVGPESTKHETKVPAAPVKVNSKMILDKKSLKVIYILSK